MEKITGGRRCRRAFMAMMASAIAIAAIGSVAIVSFGSIDAAGETSGTCGYDLTWTIDSDGNLVIEGTGPMDELEIGAEAWGGNDVVTVTIGDSVTSVCSNAFYGCTSLESVVIPDSVRMIGAGAFDGCTSLLKIGFGNGLMSMTDAFRSHVFYDSDGTTALGDDASDYAGSFFTGASADEMVRSDWPAVTVTFDANEGQCSVGSVKTENGRIASVPVPTREGYVFDGWSTSASGGAGVTGSTLFVEDATVYAQWAAPSEQDKSVGNAAYAGIAAVIALMIAGEALYRRLRRSQ